MDQYRKTGHRAGALGAVCIAAVLVAGCGVRASAADPSLSQSTPAQSAPAATTSASPAALIAATAAPTAPADTTPAAALTATPPTVAAGTPAPTASVEPTPATTPSGIAAATTAPTASPTVAPIVTAAPATPPPSAPAATVAPAPSPTPAPPVQGTATTVSVTLVDVAIKMDRTSAPGGTVTFAIKNGGSTIHELIVLKTDVPQDQIPVDAAKPASVTEPGFLAQTGNLAPGASASLTLTLSPGKYVLMCNQPAHYLIGMHTAFTAN